MSERIVNDPSQHGWVEVDGKWMWGASGGSGGSIQDGDTEGQITTWDGTEWTPEGAVVVSGGNVGIGNHEIRPDGGMFSKFDSGSASDIHLGAIVGTSNGFQILKAANNEVAYKFNSSGTEKFIIEPNGDVGIGDGDLSVTSSTNTAAINLKNSVGNYEISNNEFGSIAINYNGAEKFVLASNGDVYISGKLFVNGQEVTAGGGGGGGGFWEEESPGVIKYTGTAKATDLVAG